MSNPTIYDVNYLSHGYANISSTYVTQRKQFS